MTKIPNLKQNNYLKSNKKFGTWCLEFETYLELGACLHKAIKILPGDVKAEKK